MELPVSKLTKNQTQTRGPVRTRTGWLIATIRHDDSCGNGHNTFCITGELYRTTAAAGMRSDSGCIAAGRLDEEIGRAFPDLKDMLRFNNFSTDGPLHYVANTTYHASDRDHYGLRKGEVQHIHNGKTGLPAWRLEPEGEMLPSSVDSEFRPEGKVTYSYKPMLRIGEGKEPDLEAARSVAAWPDATLEQLQDVDALRARLPALMEEFRAAVESLGMEY